MEQSVGRVLSLAANELPAALVEWLAGQGTTPVLVTIERLGDGQWVLQAEPEIDPLLIARVRRTLAQHDDVLRRLT